MALVLLWSRVPSWHMQLMDIKMPSALAGLYLADTEGYFKLVCHLLQMMPQLKMSQKRLRDNKSVLCEFCIITADGDSP